MLATDFRKQLVAGVFAPLPATHSIVTALHHKSILYWQAFQNETRPAANDKTFNECDSKAGSQFPRCFWYMTRNSHNPFLKPRKHP